MKRHLKNSLNSLNSNFTYSSAITLNPFLSIESNAIKIPKLVSTNLVQIRVKLLNFGKITVFLNVISNYLSELKKHVFFFFHPLYAVPHICHTVYKVLSNGQQFRITQSSTNSLNFIFEYNKRAFELFNLNLI